MGKREDRKDRGTSSRCQSSNINGYIIAALLELQGYKVTAKVS